MSGQPARRSSAEMYVVDAALSQRIDRESIAEGVSGKELMELAGAGAARHILERPVLLEGHILILCGPGNNGGDGLILAHHLAKAGQSVVVLLLADPERLSRESAHMFDQAIASGVRMIQTHGDASAELDRLDHEFPGRLLVDALLGTGAELPLRPEMASLCQRVRTLSRTIVALDVPTGIDATDASLDPAHLSAGITLSFGLPKWGTFLGNARRACGQIILVPLPYPASVVQRCIADSPFSTAIWMGGDRAALLWPALLADSHKYSVGSLLVVGGSRGMSGAPALASLAALRAGAGMVECVVPGSQALAVDLHCLEAVVGGELEDHAGGLSPEALPGILARAGRHAAVVAGVGGGDSLSGARLWLSLCEELECPLVLDADGLNAMARLQRIPRFPEGTVLTPHSGELLRIPGVDPERFEADRREALRALAAELGVVILHKGAPTMVAAPDGRLAVIASGGPALATAGTGDILAGMVGRFITAGLDSFDAASLAAYLHGRAADLHVAQAAAASMIARDLLNALPLAVREMEDAQP